MTLNDVPHPPAYRLALVVAAEHLIEDERRYCDTVVSIVLFPQLVVIAVVDDAQCDGDVVVEHGVSLVTHHDVLCCQLLQVVVGDFALLLLLLLLLVLDVYACVDGVHVV